MNTPPPIIRTFIINLPFHEERRKRMLEQLKPFPNLEPEIVPALWGKDIPEVIRHALAAPDPQKTHKPLTPGEIGCALSHRLCYERFLQTKAEYALFLEDDTLLANDFGSVMESLHSFLLQKTNNPLVVAFSARSLSFVHPCVKGADWALVRSVYTIGAYAYVLNRKGAELVLNKTVPFHTPCDYWTFFKDSFGLRMYNVQPHKASYLRPGEGGDSTMDEEREIEWKHFVQVRRDPSKFTLAKLNPKRILHKSAERLLLRMGLLKRHHRLWPTEKEELF